VRKVQPHDVRDTFGGDGAQVALEISPAVEAAGDDLVRGKVRDVLVRAFGIDTRSLVTWTFGVGVARVVADVTTGGWSGAATSFTLARA